MGIILYDVCITEFNDFFDDCGFKYMKMLIKYNDEKLSKMIQEAETLNTNITNDLLFSEWEKLYTKQFNMAERWLANICDRKQKKITRDVEQYKKGLAYSWQIYKGRRDNVEQGYSRNTYEGREFHESIPSNNYESHFHRKQVPQGQPYRNKAQKQFPTYGRNRGQWGRKANWKRKTKLLVKVYVKKIWYRTTFIHMTISKYTVFQIWTYAFHILMFWLKV